MPDVQIIIEGNLEQTLLDYMRATKKAMIDIVNDFMRDIAFNAIRLTRAADEAAIRNLENLPWWPRYIAKRLSKGVTANFRVRVPKGQRQPKYVNGVFTSGATRGEKRLLQLAGAKEHHIFDRAGTQKVRTTRKEQRAGAGKTRTVPGRWTEDIARKASQVIIRARIRSINFLRAGWIPAARTFAQATGREIRGGGGSLDRNVVGVAKGSGQPATDADNPVATIRNAACGRKSKTPGKGLETFGQIGLNAAIAKVSQDKHDYAERKLQQVAKEFSADVVGAMSS